MGRVALIAAAASLAGCAQIFGIDNTTSPPDVALPPHATLTLERLSIGATVESTTLDLAGQTATYYVADDIDTSGLRRIPATAIGNVWDADVPDGVPASVEFTVPGTANKILYAFPNRDIIAAKGFFEHPGATAAPSPATLDVTMTLPSGYATGQTFILYAIGPWAAHVMAEGLPAVDTGATMIGPAVINYDTTAFASQVGTQPLTRITTGDRVVALRYTGPQLTAAVDVTAFDQTGTDTIAATLVDVPSAPLDVTVDPMAITTRLGQPAPSGSATSMSFVVSAAPGYLYSVTSGVQLTTGSVDTASGSSKISADFGNPFVTLGWHSLFTWSSQRTRMFTPPALNLPATLYSGLIQYLEPSAGSQVDLPSGLPVLVLVNSTPLTSDGLTVTIDPNKLVKLSLVADKTANTFYLYSIDELSPNMGSTALDRKSVYQAVGPGTDITIPAGVFTTGKTYTVRAHCYRGGYPSIASGDLTMRDLPLSVGYHDSGVFTVAAP